MSARCHQEHANPIGEPVVDPGCTEASVTLAEVTDGHTV
jgi:hypothetical protein